MINLLRSQLITLVSAISFITVIILGGLSNLIINKSNQKLRNEYVNYAKTRGAEYDNRNRKSLNVS